MTVRELIEKLSKLPKKCLEAEVVIYGHDLGITPYIRPLPISEVGWVDHFDGSVFEVQLS